MGKSLRKRPGFIVKKPWPWGIENAVEAALKEAAEGDVILAFGSLSYLGQVMREVKAYSRRTAPKA